MARPLRCLADVTIDASDDDNFDDTVAAPTARGDNRSNRKYLVFVDASVYGGIGHRETDDNHDDYFHTSPPAGSYLFDH